MNANLEKERNYERFEQELLQVLKNDKEHSIPFDKMLAFKSRRFDCVLAAADVRLDSKTGELVMVGAFKSGKPIIDTSKGYPVMKVDVEIPLRECYEDLKMSSGQEDRLLNKAKKAVLDKYVTGYVNSFAKRGLTKDNKLVFENFGLDDFKIDHSSVLSLTHDGNNITVTSSNSFSPSFDTKISRFHLTEMQEIGSYLKQIEDKYKEAVSIYSARKKELEPLSMTQSERDTEEHNRDALLTMYKGNFPMAICNSVAQTFAGSDMFDLDKHSLSEIHKLVSGYKPAKPHKHPVYKGPSL